jgi:hypothetical protein
MNTRDPRPAATDDDALPRAEDAAWIDAARRGLDEGVEALDAATLSRLNRARQAALEVARRSRRPAWRWPVAFAAAASLVLAVAVAPRIAPVATPDEPAIGGADLELLAASDDLALYEDLEFYAWLDAQQPSGG